jgi:molybdopterin synthase catalytic subunit
MMSFAIAREPMDLATLRMRVENGRAGAMVCFEGWVRNHSEGRAVGGLDYDVYEALAIKEGERIIAEARERFAILEVVCVHRAGTLAIGDCAVWVGVASAHRAAAFEACRYVIDEVKTRVPIWKREHYVEGEAEWVECSACAAHRARPVATADPGD